MYSCRIFLTRCIPLALLLGLFTGQALAVCLDSGFEDEDGNLVQDDSCTDSDTDWNDFAPAEWDQGTAPYRQASESVAPWDFTGLEDDGVSTSDTAFSGGTKQDDDCPTLKAGGGKAPNKDDLERVFISSGTVDGDIFLNLAWVRIPQNTTSPSAHIGFEFNQGESACPGASGTLGLVERTVGDLLIVYDFEGGEADTPTLTLREWIDSGNCEVGSNSPPCWGESVDLTASGFAEAKVNVSSVGTVDDDLTPPNSGTTSVTETLGLNEFGEAGINLTAAGVFGENECLAFGTAYAVSRSSGSSAQAQMKDLAGPGDINIANCGRVIIRKVTDPSPDSSNTDFDYTTTGGLSPSSFSLMNGESQDYGATIFAGLFTVTESTPPSGWEFTSLDCSASSTTNGTTINTAGAPTVSFDLKPLDTVDCTYTNTALGDITVTKDVVNACATDTGTFDLFIDGPEAGTGDKTIADNVGDNGMLMVGDLGSGTYAIGEEDYTVADYTTTFGGDADCSDESISLGAGDSVSCTITNVRKPTIKIVKELSGSSGPTFDLLVDDGANGSYEHETEAQGDGGMTSVVTVSTVKSGSGTSTVYGPVKLTETTANGAGLGTESITGFTNVWICDDTGTTSGSNTTSVTVPELLPGEEVVCTVTNIPTANAACSPGS